MRTFALAAFAAPALFLTACGSKQAEESTELAATEERSWHYSVTECMKRMPNAEKFPETAEEVCEKMVARLESGKYKPAKR